MAAMDMNKAGFEQALAGEVIPTLLLYRGGRALGTLVAPDSKAAIDRFLAGRLGE